VNAAIDLGAALPGQAFQPFIGRLGMMFDRLPRGWEKPWHKWPQAAQRLISVLGECARFCRLMPDGLYERFVLSDPQIMRKLEELEDKVGRRCVQKGLKQLEDLGVIRRTRVGGTRFIQFLVNFTKPKPRSQSGRKSGEARKPAARSTSSPDVPPADKPDGPPPDPEPTLSQKEYAAQLRNLIGTEDNPQSTEATRRRIGASLDAAVPTTPDPQRIRQKEEQRRRTEEWLGARKQAKQVSGQDQAAPPTTPRASDETARE
jgi:hypothetical protein